MGPFTVKELDLGLPPTWTVDRWYSISLISEKWDWKLWEELGEGQSEDAAVHGVPELLNRNIRELRLAGPFLDRDLAGILLERE
jgi:hypothetical protein